MAPATPTLEAPFLDPGLTALQRGWGFYLALGVFLVLLGGVAIATPLFATLAGVLMFGWLLIVSGLVQLFGAFGSRRWSGYFLHLLGGVLALIIYGVALDLRIDDFVNVFRRPVAPLSGLLAQLALLPAVTWAITMLLKPQPSIALGMIVVAGAALLAASQISDNRRLVAEALGVSERTAYRMLERHGYRTAGDR